MRINQFLGLVKYIHRKISDNSIHVLKCETANQIFSLRVFDVFSYNLNASLNCTDLRRLCPDSLIPSVLFRPSCFYFVVFCGSCSIKLSKQLNLFFHKLQTEKFEDVAHKR